MSRLEHELGFGWLLQALDDEGYRGAPQSAGTCSACSGAAHWRGASGETLTAVAHTTGAHCNRPASATPPIRRILEQAAALANDGGQPVATSPCYDGDCTAAFLACTDTDSCNRACDTAGGLQLGLLVRWLARFDVGEIVVDRFSFLLLPLLVRLPLLPHSL